MSNILGDCCDQNFHIGDKIQCISSGYYGWIYRIKSYHLKYCFIIKWIDGPKVGTLQMITHKSNSSDFTKVDPLVNDTSQGDLTSYIPD